MSVREKQKMGENSTNTQTHTRILSPYEYTRYIQINGHIYTCMDTVSLVHRSHIHTYIHTYIHAYIYIYRECEVHRQFSLAIYTHTSAYIEWGMRE